MSELLDELARSLARPMPMPRRHALRVLGGAALGVWFGRSAQPGRAATSQHWCHGEVSKNGWKYCQQESQACFPACCPRERICSKGPCGSNGCCQWSCCDPCNPRGSRPDGKGGCAPGPVAATCCKGPKCRDGTCCPRPNRCVDGKCCPAIRTTFAPGTRGRGVACCPPGTVAVRGGTGLCCRRGDRDCCERYDSRIVDDEGFAPLPLRRGRLCVNGRIRRS